MPVRAELCRCGHGREFHDHLRRGTDCAECGAEGCASYRAVAGGGGRVGTAVSRLFLRQADAGVVLPYRAKGSSSRPDARPLADGADTTDVKRRTGSGDVSKEA